MNRRRMVFDKLWFYLSIAAVIIALVPLVSIIYDVAATGLSTISVAFVTSLPLPPGVPGGGVSNAIVGTFILVTLGSGVGIPIGVLSGVYVSEYGNNRYGGLIHFLADVLSGIPSIVVGIVVYALIVLELHHFSALAGGLALAIIMIPISSNATTAALRAVPESVREASAALGARKWRTSFLVVSNAKVGVSTGVLLSIARISGESAPLLLTALGSTLPFEGLNQPTASLPVLIYTYATSSFKVWQAQAWGAALLLLFFVLGINIGVRWLTGRGLPTIQ